MRRPKRDACGQFSFRTALAEHFPEKRLRVDAMRCIMRARVNTARFLQVRAEVAGCGLLLDDRLLASGIFRIVSQDFKGMQIDIAVGTIARAQSAADAPILDDDFERIAAANRADGAANHAKRVAALAATGTDEIAVEAQAVAHQARDSVVRISARVDAGIAARTVLQIENEQALRFHQTLR